MAKKSSTIHVESFVWDEIDNIQKEQGISSRNTAIEYLVAEYRGLKNQSVKPNTVITEIKEEVKPKIKDAFDIALDNLEDGMAD